MTARQSDRDESQGHTAPHTPEPAPASWPGDLDD